MENVIELRELTKTYGTRRGLTGLTLDVVQGEVFGFLGPNGAGKSTTIRLLLDLIRPTAGRATVLGLDPRGDGVQLRRRVGYLAGDFVCDGRQNVRAYLQFLAELRGGVPQARIDALADRLGLDQSTKIKKLSKGNRQKVGLVQAFMHTPELLVLDEPSSGLDPLVQQTFLDMVAEAAAGGQTVFMSSHIMSEVEAVADRVGIIRDGSLVALDTVANLRTGAICDVEVTFEASVPVSAFEALPGVGRLHLDETGTRLTCQISGPPDAFIKALAHFSVTGLRATEPALDEVFHAYYDGAEGAPRTDSTTLA
ncbi:ABC transporter ATP-binding protein [Streptomyces globisporus]|uniref:ABC transporter ATP-binding protein n=1 Tax=Streptomyces TaxID=1883 RepID=UPI000B50EFC7|nr:MULTISPECIES: ABC transporter ATP-binding protein [unclassified Streptomyces]MYW99297.1 ATP-binding cassette domain-containing protein [Streptomyces sp. SID8378]PVD08966.1 ABC transporter ATP-binding protein [Streptomyces sp. CS147]SNB90292.1 ABC-2 type transport system ATP-binding protein [Streptomyces sp. PgraA7]